MARRKSAFVDEGSDSDDSDTEQQQQPSFVKASKFPSFVKAGEAPRASDEAPPTGDEVPGAFARRSMGAGLGAQFVAASSAPQVPTDSAATDYATPAEKLGAAPAPSTAGPALSRTVGSGKFDPSAYLRQMGWTGGGLGREGQGIAEPIQVQLRPSRGGLAFGGQREKTKQARDAERRERGEPVSDDETPDARAAPKSATRVRAWRRREKHTAPRIVYRTYDEIVASSSTAPTPELVLDATQGEMREVPSVAAALARYPVPTSDSMHMPELRHNIQLLCEKHRDALERLATQGAALRERARWIRRESEETVRRLAAERSHVAPLASVVEAVAQLSAAAEHAAGLEALAPHVALLLDQPADAAASLGLDEAVAGAMVPALRRAVAAWDPLAEPHAFTTPLAAWLPLLLRGSSDASSERPMTPYESVLWNVWMPAVRAALTNAWDVYDAAPAVSLVEAWCALVPPFIYDNLLDQLVLPKVGRAVQAWAPKHGVPLHVFVLPWLPLCGPRLNAVLDDVRRQWRQALSTWRVADGVPPELLAWRGVFAARDWEALLLERIVPALARALRTQFRVDPAAQDMRVLEQVLAWHGVLRDSVLSRLLEAEFGAAWLLVLHAWLTQPDVHLGEVAAWYEFWRAWFPPGVARLDGLSRMFMRALRHVNAALDRGARRTSLAPPPTAPTSRGAAMPLPQQATPAAPPPRPADLPPVLEEVTFRQVLEERATERDLFVRSLNRLEPVSGLALLRISAHVDGKNGATFFVDDDVAFVATRGETDFEPVALEELFGRVDTHATAT